MLACAGWRCFPARSNNNAGKKKVLDIEAERRRFEEHYPFRKSRVCSHADKSPLLHNRLEAITKAERGYDYEHFCPGKYCRRSLHRLIN